MSEQHRREYLARIHRAQDFIERNLGSELTLEAIASQACFSPYHFHRIFSAMTGETLYRFILRLRLERAASMLCGMPERSVTEIALDSGFGSSSAFARAFRNEYGVSASEFRKNGQLFRKDGQAVRKQGEDGGEVGGYEGSIEAGDTGRRLMTMNSSQAMKEPTQIEVRDLPARTLAYVRHVGPYAGDPGLFERLWGRIMAWAGPRDLIGRPGTEMMAVYHDDPGITEEQNLRVSLGLTVPEGTVASGEVNLLEIPAGRWALLRFELDTTEYGAAWNYVMGKWLPQSGYQCDDRPHYESYLNDPKTHPQGKCVTEICIPVKPL